MIPACRVRPRPGRRPLGIPVHHSVVASMQARQRFPNSRAPGSHPALSLPATRDMGPVHGSVASNALDTVGSYPNNRPLFMPGASTARRT